jgi:hypothetical protein
VANVLWSLNYATREAHRSPGGVVRVSHILDPLCCDLGCDEYSV